MLSMQTERQGTFELTCRALTEEEKKYYGIFISHSNTSVGKNQEYFRELIEALRARHLYPLCDRDFLKAGDDFQQVIEQFLDCYAGIFLVSEQSLRSPWCNYELGVFSAHRTPVFLWDPDGLLYRQENSAFMSGHIGKYLPAYRTLSDLMTAVENASPYADMCLEENRTITKADFIHRLSESVQTVIMGLSTPRLSEVAGELSRSRIGLLIVHFGMFSGAQSNGDRCFCRRFGNTLKDGICPLSQKKCALCGMQEITEENRECVILNHLSYSGKHIPKGQADVMGNIMEEDTLLFRFPLNRNWGTEFKIILDTPDDGDYGRLMKVLDEVGLNPTGSLGYVGGRIYLSLPDRREVGLFRIDAQFNNNLLCAWAGRETEKRDV